MREWNYGKNMNLFKESLVELITQTSTNLPPDVRAAMGLALEDETPHTQAAQALAIIAANIDMAQADEGPVCQDTGMPTFIVHTPVGVNQITLKKAIHDSTAEITRKPEVMYSDALAPSDVPNRPTIRKPSSGRKTMA